MIAGILASALLLASASVLLALNCDYFDKVCNLYANFGGRNSVYESAVERAIEEGYSFRITGECFSACALAAVTNRANTCVGRYGKLAFHLPRPVYITHIDGVIVITQGLDLAHAVPPRLPHDFAAWIASKGGWKPPADDGSDLIVMEHDEALHFFPACEKNTIR